MAITILSEDSLKKFGVVKPESEPAALCVVCAAGDGFSLRAFVSPRQSSFCRQAYAWLGALLVLDPAGRSSIHRTYSRRSPTSVFVVMVWESRPNLFHCDRE